MAEDRGIQNNKSSQFLIRFQDQVVHTFKMGAKIIGSRPEFDFLLALTKVAAIPWASGGQVGMHASLVAIQVISSAETFLATTIRGIALVRFDVSLVVFPGGRRCVSKVTGHLTSSTEWERPYMSSDLVLTGFSHILHLSSSGGAKLCESKMAGPVGPGPLSPYAFESREHESKDRPANGFKSPIRPAILWMSWLQSMPSRMDAFSRVS